MRLDAAIDDFGKSPSLCLRCMVCTYGNWPENHPLCSIYERYRVFTASPGGLMYVIRALTEHKAVCKGLAAEFAYDCTLCGACNICEIIPIPAPHVSPVELIRCLRNHLVKEGMMPDWVGRLHRTVQGKMARPTRKAVIGSCDGPALPAAQILFVDGMESGNEQRIYECAKKLCQKMGESVVTYEVPGPLKANDLYDLGFWKELEVLLARRSDELKFLEGKELLFIDPHTQAFMLKTYLEIGSRGFALRGRSFIEAVQDGLEEGRLKAAKRKVKVTYHDPCQLGRALKIYDSPRKVLSFLGAELIEMKRNREDAFCCGGGRRGGGHVSEFAEWTALERLRDFAETRADILITGCPRCTEVFREFVDQGEKDRIKNLIEFAYEATEA